MGYTGNLLSPWEWVDEEVIKENTAQAASREKGHVPEEHLFEYRKLKNISDQFKSLGDSINTLNYADSSLCYYQARIYLEKATALRVDIPKKKS